MRRKIVAVCLIAFVGWQPGCNSRTPEGQTHVRSDPIAARSDQFLHNDPLVVPFREPDLVLATEELPAFAERLEALAKDHGWGERLARCKVRFLRNDWEERRALALQSGSEHFVVVLLKSWSGSIPGDDMQAIILLDEKGRFQDSLTCVISSRICRDLFDSPTFRTVVLKEPAKDGSQLIVRLDGASVRGNFSHHITHDGKTRDYYWGHDHLPQERPTTWDIKGLCRVAIENSKLRVLFPGEAK